MTGIRNQIVDFLYGEYLKDRKRYVSGKVIEDLKIFRKYKTSNVSRRCRELAEDGLIKRVLTNGSRYVMYRFLKHPKSVIWKTYVRHRMDKSAQKNH